MSGVGAVIGLLLGLGVVLVSGRLLAVRTPSTVMRIAPFVPGLRHRADPGPGPIGALVAIAGTLRPRVQRGRSPHDGLTVLAHALVGTAAGLGLGVVAIARGSAVGAPVLLGALGCVCGILVLDRRAVHRARRRRESAERELPILVDLLAFAVAAGESPADAMRRVSAMASGVLADEMRAAVQDVRAGLTVEQALGGMAGRIDAPDVDRFVDTVVIALDRGTPIAEVLRAQAADARVMQRRRLMESAGRKDIAMLVPIVFLILPVVVAIALFPGVRALQVLVP